jgi:hypothetical protein
MKTTEGDLVVRARRWCRDYYHHNKADHRHEHPSHLASEAINLAGVIFKIGYGAEGFCWDGGADSITYLNMGDAYDYTVLFDSRTERFTTGAWGDVVERLERDGITLD